MASKSKSTGKSKTRKARKSTARTKAKSKKAKGSVRATKRTSKSKSPSSKRGASKSRAAAVKSKRKTKRAAKPKRSTVKSTAVTGDDESARKAFELAGMRSLAVQKKIAAQRAKAVSADIKVMKASKRPKVARAAAKAGVLARGVSARGGGAPAARVPLRILAEGDSWFHYPEIPAIITRLANLTRRDTQVVNLAHFGDEAQEMLRDEQRERLINTLSSATKANVPFEALLFSGGGNDMIGNKGFGKWLNVFQPGMSAADVLNRQAYDPQLLVMRALFLQLVQIRDAESPNTQIFVNTYDFAVPNGRRACRIAGPWLEPALNRNGVPKSLQFDVVKLFLTLFKDMLDALATHTPRFTVMPTQGVFAPTREWWLNEIHPTNKGYSRMTSLYIEMLRQHFPGRL